jgi:murein DD-endopeptidase MepM/ murein hydrolase activator NlpD
MANTTVEIIGGQLSGVLQNAASDATLQEIVRAVNKMSNSTGGGGGAPTPTSQSNSGSSIMESAMDMVGNQIGNLVGAMGSFAGLIASGNDKLSSYTTVLNDQIIKGLPLVGKYLGAFGDVINYSIGTFESWNQSLKQSTKSGASFNNSILELRSAANGANLSLDDFVSIISSNSETLIAFGGTVTEGAKAFADYNKYLKRDSGPVNNTLRQMGYSSKEVSEMLMMFMKNTQRGAFREKQSKEQFEKQFMFYSLNLDRLVKITGQTAQQLESKIAGVNQDAAYQAMIMNLNGDQQTMMDTGLKQFVATYGDAGAELWKALALGQQPQTDLAIDLMTMMPFASKGAKDMITSIKKGRVTLDKFDDTLRKSFVDQNMSIKDYYVKNQSLVNAMSLIEGPTGELYRAIKSAISGVGKYGKISDLTTDKLNALWKAASDEAGKREGFTKLMNDFSIAFDKFKESLIDSLMPVFKDISKSLKSEDVQARIKAFGEWLGTTIKNHLPKVTEFLKLLGSAEGREFILSEIEHFWHVLGVHGEFALKRSFNTDKDDWEKMGLTDEDKKKALNALEIDRVTRAAQLGFTIKPGGDFLGTRGVESDDGEADATNVQRPTRGDSVTGGYAKDAGAAKTAQYEQAIREMIAKSGVKTQAPLPGVPVNSQRGLRNGIFHHGTDQATKEGTEIKAPVSGSIQYKQQVKNGNLDGYGNYAEIIEPKTGTVHILGHMNLKAWEEYKKIFAGKKNTVSVGDIVGGVGNTGTSTGPHLHYEVRTKEGFSVDPRQIIGTTDAQGKHVPGFASGTMGTSSGSTAMSVEQMESIAKTGGSINIAELITTFNANMSTLIEMTKERQSIHYQQLDAQKQHSGNLALG